MSLTRLTREQAAVLGAFTGILMGPFQDLHEYAERIMGRPIMTHEFGSREVAAQLREAARDDLERLVAGVTDE